MARISDGRILCGLLNALCNGVHTISIQSEEVLGVPQKAEGGVAPTLSLNTDVALVKLFHHRKTHDGKREISPVARLIWPHKTSTNLN